MQDAQNTKAETSAAALVSAFQLVIVIDKAAK